MQIPLIKEVAEKYSLAQLKAAEEAFYEEQSPAIEIPGKDEGEQLTHVLAAIWILEVMEKERLPLAKAVREYTVRVRNSIS